LFRGEAVLLLLICVKAVKPKSDTFWTGGYEISEGNPIHCPIGAQMPNYKHWGSIKVDKTEQFSNGEEFCYVIRINSDRDKFLPFLQTRPCSFKQNFICEVRANFSYAFEELTNYLAGHKRGQRQLRSWNLLF
jgi:hypothetical protein